MPTLKKRINLSIDEDLLVELEVLKKIRHAPSLAAIVVELTKEALETQEDLYFSKIAEARKNEKTIPHHKIWK